MLAISRSTRTENSAIAISERLLFLGIERWRERVVPGDGIGPNVCPLSSVGWPGRPEFYGRSSKLVGTRGWFRVLSSFDLTPRMGRIAALKVHS